MAKRDVIHKSGSTYHIATPPEEDRATASGDLRNKFREDRSSGSKDMLADRHTDPNTPLPEMCGSGRVGKLCERPRTDADATLCSVADADADTLH